MHFKLSRCFITIFNKHFCPACENYWVTPYNHQKNFILINIIHREYTQIFSATATHRKHRKHKIQKHAFRWSLRHCNSQHYRHTLSFETPLWLCNVFLGTAAERGCRDSQLQESWLTCIYLQSADCAKRKWEWQVAVRTFHHSIIQWASRVLSLVC